FTALPAGARHKRTHGRFRSFSVPCTRISFAREELAVLPPECWRQGEDVHFPIPQPQRSTVSARPLGCRTLSLLQKLGQHNNVSNSKDPRLRHTVMRVRRSIRRRRENLCGSHEAVPCPLPPLPREACTAPIPTRIPDNALDLIRRLSSLAVPALRPSVSQDL